MKLIPFAALATLAFFTTPAHAQDEPATATLSDAPASDLEFSFNGYGWLAGLEGTSAIMGVPTNLDIEFDDVIDNLGVVWAQTFEIRKGKFSLFTDFMYLKLIPSLNGPGPFVRTDIEIEQTMFSVLGGYEILNNGQTSIELLGGARYMNYSMDIDFVGGPLPSMDGEESWWDGIAAMRIRHHLNDKFFLTGYADIGAGDSEQTWQAIGSISYQFKENIAMLVGYRYLHYDYKNGGFAYNLDTSGPLIGATIKF